jgi:hypothetical protein
MTEGEPWPSIAHIDACLNLISKLFGHSFTCGVTLAHTHLNPTARAEKGDLATKNRNINNRGKKKKVGIGERRRRENQAVSPTMEEVVGFWGPRTSNVDWCEPNYAWSHYVAEMFNFLSSLPIFALALWGFLWGWHGGYRKRFLLPLALFVLFSLSFFLSFFLSLSLSLSLSLPLFVFLHFAISKSFLI